MPMYTLRDTATAHEWDVVCSYEELQLILNEMPDVIQKLSAPKIVSGVGNIINKTPDGFKDVLGRVKSGSGRNNNVRI